MHPGLIPDDQWTLIHNHLCKTNRLKQVINAINVCLTVATVLATIFSCIPISGYWDPTQQVHHEINHASFIMSTSFLTIMTDILVLAIPFWAFVKTQLPLTTRLGVIMIFMTGGLSVIHSLSIRPEAITDRHTCFYRVTAFGIVRFCVLAEEYWEPPPIRFMNTWGPSYAAFETNLAITTACLPALRPLFRKWFPNMFSDAKNEESRASEGRSYNTTGGSGNNNSIRMRDFNHKRGNARCGSDSTAGSLEPIINSAGIRRTTEVGRFP